MASAWGLLAMSVVASLTVATLVLCIDAGDQPVGGDAQAFRCPALVFEMFSARSDEPAPQLSEPYIPSLTPPRG